MAHRESYLLVEPSFPIPPKSKNHKDFLPIGLLKLGTWLHQEGNLVQIVRGNVLSTAITNEPDEIWITSLFTYWSKYVKESVEYYRTCFPHARITVGGIYASLMPEHCKNYTQCDEVHQGVYPEAESVIPDYGLLPQNPHPIDFQILHSSRGCFRKCDFCGTWKIEPKYEPKASIRSEIFKEKVVFYDNNLLHNPNIESILSELIALRKQRKLKWCESQSGFDGRVLLERPELGKMLKRAGFRYPRIAWDWGYDQRESIRKQLGVLFKAGFAPKDVYVFVLYNWNISFSEMEQKRIQCYRWGVQISDCRYRPLDQTYDEFDSRKIGQTSRDYYIHESHGWTDELVKQFRQNVRKQNICIRHGFPFYSSMFERKQVDPKHAKMLKSLESIGEKEEYLRALGIDAWFPQRVSYPKYLHA